MKDLVSQNVDPPNGLLASLGRRLFVLKQACLGFRSACESEGRVVFGAGSAERDCVVAAEVQLFCRLNTLTFEYQLVSPSAC